MYLRRGNDLLMIAHWQVNFKQFAYLLQGLNKNGTNETFAMVVRDSSSSKYLLYVTFRHKRSFK